MRHFDFRPDGSSFSYLILFFLNVILLCAHHFDSSSEFKVSQRLNKLTDNCCLIYIFVFLLSSAPSHQISFDDMLTVYVLYTEKVDFCLHFFLTFLKRLSASKFLNHDQKIIFFAFIFNVCLGSFFSGHLHRVIALLPVYHIAIKRLKRIKLNPTSGVCLQVHVKMSC